MVTLRLVDRQVARVVKAAQAAPRPYRFIVLSDHGQSQGMTFLDRYGISLEDLVSTLSRGEGVQAKVGGEDDAQAYLNASVTEVANDRTFFGRLVSRFSRGKVKDGEVGPDSSGRDENTGESHDPIPELSVMASGCLGLINFPREPGRMTIERLEDLHPALIEGLAAHPGIGFVLINSEKHGAIAVGANGTNFLEMDLIEGEDPLETFGPNTKAHVLRTHGFPHCPDIMVNSTYWHETDEVAAFEELVGSHGGLGGLQSYPFVLHPVDLEWPEEGVIGAENIYHLFKDWTAQIAPDNQSSAVDSPGSSTLTSTVGDVSAT